MIVLSILLAFGIEAGWEEMGARREEAEILQALRQDFSANRSAAERVIAAHRNNNVRFAYLTGLTSAAVADLPADSVSAIMGSLSGPYTFDAVRGTIDGLIGAGKLDLIRDSALRDALITFINLVEDAKEDAEFMGRAAERVWIHEVAHGGPWVAGGSVAPPFLSSPTARTLSGIRSDAPMMGAIRQFQATGFAYAAEIEDIGAQATHVLAVLDRQSGN